MLTGLILASAQHDYLRDAAGQGADPPEKQGQTDGHPGILQGRPN